MAAADTTTATPATLSGADVSAPRGSAADRQAYLVRLRRIEGQVRGVQKMVAEDRWCPDVITQQARMDEVATAIRQVVRL